jgi:hypothetical protein
VLDLQHAAGFLGENRVARQNESCHGDKTEASGRAFHCFLLDALTLYLLTLDTRDEFWVWRRPLRKLERVEKALGGARPCPEGRLVRR